MNQIILSINTIIIIIIIINTITITKLTIKRNTYNNHDAKFPFHNNEAEKSENTSIHNAIIKVDPITKTFAKHNFSNSFHN